MPELGDEVALLPWLGFTQDGIPRALSGEKRGAHRVEAIVHHRPSGTLFFTDHFFNLSTDKPLKPNTSGFRLVDGAAARASARRVLDAKAQRVVFSLARPAAQLRAAARGAGRRRARRGVRTAAPRTWRDRRALVQEVGKY